MIKRGHVLALATLLSPGCSDDSNPTATGPNSSGGNGGSGGSVTGGSAGVDAAGLGATGGATSGSAGTNTGGLSGSAGSPTGGGGSPAGSGGAPAVGPDGLFLADYVYYKDVSSLAPAPESNAIIGTLDDMGGWGSSNRFSITFSFDFFEADATTPVAVFDEIQYASHSDTGSFPVVPGGALEDMNDYVCTGEHDCHYLVVRQDERVLYELFAASELSAGHWRAGSFAKWYLDSPYGDNQRGFGCTSADAAGLPISPGLIRVKEVVGNGEIHHALRFILPNARMRYRSLVAPATHFGAPSSDDPNAPPYGVRFRLKSSFDENAIPSPGGRVIVRALKRYGMILSDGGQIALTAERDRFTTEKWAGILSEHDLDDIRVTDFEVVDFGPVQSFTEYPDCTLQNPP